MRGQSVAIIRKLDLYPGQRTPANPLPLRVLPQSQLTLLRRLFVPSRLLSLRILLQPVRSLVRRLLQPPQLSPLRVPRQSPIPLLIRLLQPPQLSPFRVLPQPLLSLSRRLLSQPPRRLATTPSTARAAGRRLIPIVVWRVVVLQEVTVIVVVVATTATNSTSWQRYLVVVLVRRLDEMREPRVMFVVERGIGEDSVQDRIVHAVVVVGSGVQVRLVFDGGGGHATTAGHQRGIDACVQRQRGQDAALVVDEARGQLFRRQISAIRIIGGVAAPQV